MSCASPAYPAAELHVFVAPLPFDEMRDEVLGPYLLELVRRIAETLRGSLVGVYLHGSAAMGAFVPSRSDVDVLVVTHGPIPAREKDALAELLSEPDLACPGVGLELSVVTLEAARTPSDAPSFELHLATEEGRVADRGTDPDLVAHLATARTFGRSLLGPPPEEVIAPVDRDRLLRSLADDLAWAIQRSLPGYAVLNACRSLRFAREGALCSKPGGAKWALREGIADPALIRAALRRQLGADEEVEQAAALAFAERARNELLSLIKDC